MSRFLPLPSIWEMTKVETDGTKHHRDAGDDARDAERYDDTAEHEMGRCAEILRRLDQPAVELDEHGVDGQHHERQEVVDHAEHDRALRVDERNIVERIAEMRLEEGNRPIERKNPLMKPLFSRMDIHA